MDEKSMPTIAQFIIRSCDRRVLELEQVKAWLEGNGYKLSKNHWDVDPRADLILLTTCGVTQLHEDFTFEIVDQIKAEKKPGAKVIMGGCVPEINPQRVSEEFGGSTFSPQSYHKLDEILNLPRKLDEFDRPNTYDMRALYRTDVGNMIRYAKSFRGHKLDYRDYARKISHSVETIHRRRRTYLIQIHEGCSMGCSYWPSVSVKVTDCPAYHCAAGCCSPPGTTLSTRSAGWQYLKNGGGSGSVRRLSCTPAGWSRLRRK
jgi:tRNA A37 methylthiotransferase MiaB